MKTGFRKDTVKKYFDALKALREEIESGKLDTISEFQRTHKISTRTCQTLQELNIIKKNGFRSEVFFTWNDKIPVTMLLANKVVSKNNEPNKIYHTKLESDNRVKNGGARKGAGRKKKIITTVIESKSNIGLIRRFLRWIY